MRDIIASLDLAWLSNLDKHCSLLNIDNLEGLPQKLGRPMKTYCGSDCQPSSRVEMLTTLGPSQELEPLEAEA